MDKLYIGILLICVPLHSSVAFFPSRSLTSLFLSSSLFFPLFRYCVKRCLIPPRRAWPPFNLRLSIAGFNHGLRSINEDDGDKGKDYGTDTFSPIAERLNLNGGSPFKKPRSDLIAPLVIIVFHEDVFHKAMEYVNRFCFKLCINL